MLVLPSPVPPAAAPILIDCTPGVLLAASISKVPLVPDTRSTPLILLASRFVTVIFEAFSVPVFISEALRVPLTVNVLDLGQKIFLHHHERLQRNHRQSLSVRLIL